MMKLGDKLVLLGGIIFVGWLYSALWFSSDDKVNFAQVTVDGEEKLILNLEEDQIVDTTGRAGISKLEIAGGRIRFLESPCPNKICINAGWLQHGGDFAACLPNRVAVEVAANNKLFDTINF